MIDLEQVMPYAAPLVSAAAAWYLGSKRQNSATLKMERDWLERSRQEAQALIDERLGEMRSTISKLEMELELVEKQRDRFQIELVRLKTRIALLEEQSKRQETERVQETSRLKRIITQLRHEKSELEARLSQRDAS